MNKYRNHGWIGILIYAWMAFLGVIVVFRAGASAPMAAALAHAEPSLSRFAPQTNAYAPTVQLGRWVTESLGVMEMAVRLGDRALRLDAEDHIHIAYGGSQLTYATFDGAAWLTETIDDSTVRVSHTSLALDEQGRPHISYFDEATPAIMYARLTESGWQTETIEVLDGAAQDSSLALDRAGAPHVSYATVISDVYDVRYAQRMGDAWAVEVVDDETANGVGHVDGPTSLALDSQEYPHIVYRLLLVDVPRSFTAIRHAYWNGNGWTTETAEWDVTADSPRLVLDDGDVAHLSFVGTIGFYDPALLYANTNTGVWTVETVEASAWWYRSTALALYGEQPLMAFLDYDSLRFAYKEQGAWHFSTVDTVTGNGLAIDLNQSGRPVILYTDSDDTRIKIARQVEPAWFFLPLAFR